MNTCENCGVEFPTGSGWNACGECLSAQIELALLRELGLNGRKPMRRASPDPRDDASRASEEPNQKTA